MSRIELDHARGKALHASALGALGGAWMLVTILALVAHWTRPIASSLWLDELGTYWIVRGGLAETIDRAWRFAGQSPLYYMVAWAAKEIGGAGEVVLRIPSLGAALVCLVLLYRLAHRLFDREVAQLATIVFAAAGPVAFAAIDARPYVFADLALICATLLLVRWFDEGGARLMIGYGIAAAATVTFHHLFGLALLIHIPYGVTRWRTRAGEPLQLALGIASLVALTLPLLPRLAHLHSRSAELNLPLNDTSLGAFLGIIAPPALFGAAFIGFGLAAAAGRIEVRTRSAAPGAARLALSWAVLPPASLWIASQLTSGRLPSTTYARSAIPGLALLLGAGLASIAPVARRRVIVLSLVLISLIANGGAWHNEEDWRGASHVVNNLVGVEDQIPVLVHWAFVGSKDLDLSDDPQTRSWLLAPLARYPMDGEIILLPYFVTDDAELYLEGVVQDQLRNQDKFILVTLHPFVPYRAWLEGRLGQLGFSSRQVGEHGSLEVVLFQRPE